MGRSATASRKKPGLLKEWPKEGPKLLWQVKDIGYGFSTPSVVGDRLYLLSNKGTDNEFVQARSVADGKEIWTTRLGKVGRRRPNNPGARSTPTVDGDLLYALSSDGDLACLKIADGTVVWRKSLRKDFGGQPGPGPMPNRRSLTATLSSAPGGKVATIVALDKKTGKTVWQTALPEADDAAYASAIIVEIGGVRQYVQFLQKGVVGVDAKTGKYLWRYGKIGPNDPAHITTPVARDGFVYFSLGETGGALFKVKDRQGEVHGRARLCQAERALEARRLHPGGRLSLRHQGGGPAMHRIHDRRRKMARQERRPRLLVFRRRPALPSRRKRRRGPGGTDAGSLPRERPFHAARTAGSRRLRRPGRIRSSPTGDCTCAIWGCCGATM